MIKQTALEIKNLLYVFADYDLFNDRSVKNNILGLDENKNVYNDFVGIYENAYNQKPELFQGIEHTFKTLVNDNDLKLSNLQWKFFKQYFNEIWEMATNSYFEDYPLPDNMEYPNLLNLKINLI